MRKIIFEDKYNFNIEFHPKFICGRESMYSLVGKEIQRGKSTRGT